MAQGEDGRNADEDARTGTGDGQDRQIKHDLDIFYDQGCHDDLPQVMENTAGCADADDREFPRLLQDHHGPQAESGPGDTVQESVDAAAKGRSQECL